MIGQIFFENCMCAHVAGGKLKPPTPLRGTGKW